MDTLQLWERARVVSLPSQGLMTVQGSEAMSDELWAWDEKPGLFVCVLLVLWFIYAACTDPFGLMDPFRLVPIEHKSEQPR
jgi:hypothetical protein